MAMYEYQGQTPAGREMAGTLEAESLERATEVLGLMRVTVASLREVTERAPVSRIGRSEFALFNQQLASIAKAGVPLEQSLKQLVCDVRSRRVRSLINAVTADLESGSSIEDAFARHGRNFPPMYGHILAAGIKTGRLAEMLTSLNRHLHFASQTRRMVIESMSYPLIIVALGAAIFTGIMIYVVPMFVEAVISMDLVRLPAPTRALVWLANNIGSIWLGIGIAAVASSVGWMTLRASSGGRWVLERFGFGIPLLGRIWRDSVLSRMTDSMAVLIGAGCDLPTALRMGGAASGSEMVLRECERVASHVTDGNDLADADRLCWILPGLLTHSLHVASQRNDMPDALYGLSDMYAQHARTGQTSLRAVLMPMMLIVAGLVVSMFVGALFLPLIRMISWLGM